MTFVRSSEFLEKNRCLNLVKARYTKQRYQDVRVAWGKKKTLSSSA